MLKIYLLCQFPTRKVMNLVPLFLALTQSAASVFGADPASDGHSTNCESVPVQETATQVATSDEGDVQVPAHTHLFGITYFNGGYYAAGRMRRLLRPGGDESWHWFEGGLKDETWSGIASGNGVIVAVGGKGSVAVLDEGQEWQVVEGDLSSAFSRVIFADEAFWKIGAEGLLARSADGVSWEPIPIGSDEDLRAIDYDHSSGVFVVAGAGGSLFWSQGGIEWHAVDSDPAWHIRDITSGHEGFLAVGSDGLVLRSADGASWSPIQMPLSRNRLSAVVYGNGRYVIAGGTGKDLLIYLSENGEDWEEVELPLPTIINQIIHDGARFISAGFSGSILSSETGEEWDILHSGLLSGHWGVSEGSNEDLVTVGEFGQIHRRTQEGVWQAIPTRTSSWLWDVAAGNGILVAVGDRGTILYSADAETWEHTAVPGLEGRFGGVTYGSGRFIAVGEAGAVAVSEDGSTWESLLDDPSSDADAEGEEGGEGSAGLPSSMLWSIAYGEGVFIAVGEDGAVARSTEDGLWQTMYFDEEPSLHAIAYREDAGFVIAGFPGFIAHSVDGLDWAIIPSPRVISWESITVNENLFVIAGESAIGLSADGLTWRFENADTSERVPVSRPALYYDAIIKHDRLFVVGLAGFSQLLPLPPVVFNESGDITVEIGGMITLSADPAGTGPFSYQWHHDGEPVQGADAPVLNIDAAGRDAIGEYRLLVTNEAGQMESVPFFVVVRTNYDAWALTHYGELADPAERDPNADAGQSGLPNLLAYAFDSNPAMARRYLPTSQMEEVFVDGQKNRYLTMTFTRSIGAEDIDYIPEASRDLALWHPVPEGWTIRTERDGSRENVTIRDADPIKDSEPTRFLRLRVISAN